MKKTLKVNAIYKNGTDSETILRMLGNYNEGKADISPRDLEGYFATRKAIYPLTINSELIKGDSPNEYHISEDGGKTFTMSLEWCEVYELEESGKPTLLDLYENYKKGKQTEEFLPNNINA